MRKSKLLSILLSMTLVITTVLAGTGNIFAGSITSGTSAPTSIEVQDINKVTEDTTIRYTAKVTTGSDNTAIIPITVAKAGTIAIPPIAPVHRSPLILTFYCIRPAVL